MTSTKRKMESLRNKRLADLEKSRELTYGPISKNLKKISKIWSVILDDELTKDKLLYYYVWNFFWIQGSLLSQFNEDQYIEESHRGREYKAPVNRHYTGNFPLGIYEQVNKIRLTDHRTNIGRYL